MNCKYCDYFNSSLNPTDPKGYECFLCELEKLFLSESGTDNYHYIKYPYNDLY
jgi:hypothetical protein